MNNDIIISGINMDLTDAIKSAAKEKLDKLFNHDERIVRLRVELAYTPNKSKKNEFIAKGHIEIYGPDMIVSVKSNDLYKSIDELTDKLARKLRRRHRLERVKRKQVHSLDIPHTAVPKAV